MCSSGSGSGSSSRCSEKTGRGIARIFRSRVTQDPNDSSHETIDSTELIKYLKKGVMRAEIWECPLGGLSRHLQVFGMVHQGIVVTMVDGKKYLIHKLPSEDTEKVGVGDAVVSRAKNMGKHWSFVECKDIRTATLQDYLDECGDKYDTANDNCLHAVKRMWSLR